MKYFAWSKYLLTFLVALVLGLTSFLVQPIPVEAQGNVIIVGSKDFNENIVLAHIIQLLLEDAGFIVIDNINTGNTATVRGELLAGTIDIYPEYTATGVNLLASQFPTLISPGDAFNPTTAIAIVSSFDNAYNGLSWLVPAPGNSSYALAVTRDFSEENSITTIAELANYINGGGEVNLAGTPDFFVRSDAFLTYTEAYQFNVEDSQRFTVASEDPTLTLNALRNGEADVNVAMAYSTSGELLGSEFVMLEDTLGAQPYFQPAPVIRNAILESNPDIISILRPAFALIETQTMQRFVAATTAGVEPEEVARGFLIENGFISDTQRETCFLTRTESADTSANLRSGPGLTFPVQGTLNVGTEVEANGQANGSDGATWYRLRTGLWVRADVVGLTGDCETLPVVTR
ncbi:MAG: ABC transporter substrate-binding protein [Phototrophicaceae bacterium]